MVRRLAQLAMFVLVGCLTWADAAATTNTWTGLSGIDTNWNTPSNWAGNNGPVAAADLVFPTSTQTSSNNDIPSLQINSLTISGSNYALTGNAFTLGSAAPNNGNILVNTGAASNSAAFDIALAGGAGNKQFFTVNASAGLVLSGQLSGATGSELVKSGTGMLTLSGNNSGFTGPISIDPSGGVLRIQHASALGGAAAGTVVGTNAQLQLNNIAGSVAESLVLNGSGIGGNGALLNVAGTNTITGPILLDSDTTISSTAGAMVLAGLISDSGAGHGLTIAGGNVAIGRIGGNTYRGGTIINGGKLEIFAGGATGTGSITINNGGQLVGNGGVSGAVTLNSGGSLRAGPFLSGGLHVGPLTWNGGGTIVLQLFSVHNTLFVNGALLKGTAGAYEFDFQAPNTVNVGDVFDLIQYTAGTTFAATDFSFTANNSLLDGAFSFVLPPDVGGPTLRFTVTAVPEPVSCAGLAALLLFVRRPSRQYQLPCVGR